MNHAAVMHLGLTALNVSMRFRHRNISASRPLPNPM